MYDKLNAMMGDYPKQDWYWTQQAPEDKDDMSMVFRGFCMVAFDRLGIQKRSTTRHELYSQVTGKGSFGHYPFTPSTRFYTDRFELTHRQAQVVQKIMRYLDVDYDPGGGNTPENLARRTFYYDDYLARPLTPDYPDQSFVGSNTERKIQEYLRLKNK